MNISTSKWIVILIYLIITLPVGIFLSVSATQISLLLFYFIAHGQPIDFSTINFMKIIKGSIAGGLIGAVGCWWLYYKRYRQSKNR